MNQKIRVTRGDIDDPRVDQAIAQQDEETKLRAGMGVRPQTVQKQSLLHSSWFYLGIAGLVGAFIAWAVIIEPNYSEVAVLSSTNDAITLLFIAIIGGMVGLFIGSTEGILARNPGRAVKGGLVGLALGVVGGFVSNQVANVIYRMLLALGAQLVLSDGQGLGAGERVPLLLLLVVMFARSLGWGIAGMTVGLGPGIAVKSKKMVLNGFLGGMLGGLLGGLMFDPVAYLTTGGTLVGEGNLSRAIGTCVVGAGAGLMIGLVEMFTKDAWLLMTAGPLTGKQFIIYNNPTFVGSSPKCEIYLFKDAAIEPFHAAIHKMRDAYEIEDRNSGSGTYVNGARVSRQRLADGDEVRIGRAVFIYSERAKRRTGMRA